METVQNESEKKNNGHSQMRKRRKRHILLYAAAAILLLAAIAAAVFLILYKDIHFQYRVELGDPIPSASVFSKTSDVSLRYLTDISKIDDTVAASHWFHVSENGNQRLVNLVVEDTIPPQAQPLEHFIAINKDITPDQMVTDIEDAGLVSIQWQQAPEFGTAGDYPVVIKLQDMSGNTTLIPTMLYIRAVVDTLTHEAGTSPPTLADFLADDALDAAFVTNMDSLSYHVPGTYGISIDVNGEVYTSALIVEDTIAPVITTQLLCLAPGNSPQPEDFVSKAVDATALSFSFLNDPDCSRIGFQDVVVVASDLGGNLTQQTATLLISKVAPVTVEIRGNPLFADDFPGLASYSDVALANEMVPDSLGDYDVELLLDGVAHPTRVTVVDSTPPAAEPVAVEWYVGHALPAERFVKGAFDYTEIAYAFSNEPDWSLRGTQSVSVTLTDTSGNSAEFTTSLHLEHDTKPPKLYGVKNRYCYIGQPVAYFAEVFAVDNCDEEVIIEVDNSNVNIHQAGKYMVTYTATDSAGNTTQSSCRFTFVEETVSDEQLSAAVQRVLSSIVTDDMSLGSKAQAVFKYVRKHIKYSGRSRKSDWKYEAYRGITSGRGDCFTFYATAKCLLDGIGAQTISVERLGGSTRHYWLLVDVGSGWYHFDATNVGPSGFVCFMRTDKEVASRSSYYWRFNKKLYPPTPKTPFKLE